MKKLTTIFLLTFLALGCNAQEPHLAYSVEYVDSLNNRIEFLESVIQISEVSVIADTFNLEIIDDRIKVEINKVGYNVWVDIIDGYRRINSDYIDSESKVLIMNDTITIGSMFINATNTKGTSYIEL